MVDRPGEHEGTHPTPFTYAKVASLLVTLTAIEFGVFYADIPNAAMVSIFLILSSVKFVLVILFYMHLKFDNRLFSGLFVGGLLLAITVSVALLSIFQALSALANPQETEREPPPEVQEPEQPGVTPDDGGTVEACAVDDRVCRGRELFLSVPASAAPQALWCSACHTVEGVSSGLIGPDLTNIGAEGGSRRPGMSTEAYIGESIRDPEAFICDVPRCVPGLMTESITQGLTDGEVDLLVAFLLDPAAAEVVTPPTDTPAEATAVPTTSAPGEPTVAAPSADGLVAEGEALFLSAPSNVSAQALWCSQCHTVDGVAAGAIGPDLSHIGTDAADRIPGMSAEAYIVQSIGEPEVFVATGVDRANAGLMTTAIVQDLTDEQVEALAAFLLAQR